MKDKLIVVTAIIATAIFFAAGSKADNDKFPAFITSNEDYYTTRIGKIPDIDSETYRLEIKGLVDTQISYTLDELYAMPMEELPLTVECIGNSPSGALVSTAVWKGIRLYELLKKLGVQEMATGVRYEAADGYYASHTMEQIKTNRVLLALYMNGIPIPPKHGFPVRVLNPGYYGVKQPAWVTSIEVIDRPMKDYWEDRGWDCSPPMYVDSVVFFPEKRVTVRKGETLRVGGAAFGGIRVKRVEITKDRGKTWEDVQIVKKVDADNVWVFWETSVTFRRSGNYTVNVRATDIEGNTQQETDPERYDGNNDWPVLHVRVE
jgi:DMSO/TMAO reductase YedYZ molybdopterin-dependent catalytic subunit